MATFLYKTKGNSSPERKPRVYFTCHPEDFEKYFEKICEDIFKTHDPAIYYTESMTEEIEEKYKESDLGQMNLFVIPVTFKLLSKPNRAMDSDFRYAQEKHIPVLPIMMETGLDSFYSAKDKFGEAQYLSPYVNDMTAISYEEKLKKYLESVLISNKMAERVRKAFDAYIFLSYRKKDRHYANELMKLIHSHPEFRDIAIWYDEFLTPGESFRENIEKMMQDSKLFTLLVTPSLLEYVDGKPNYVMEHEYPDAKKAGLNILPAEMEETDKTELGAKYENIPECVDPQENELFKTRLLDSLSQIEISANNNDPEHNFLIGLAYLDGIDVEKNTERGIELITSAAEANLLEAMEKLYSMYDEGKGIQVDYHKAVKWAEKIWQYYKERYGEESTLTLRMLSGLALTYSDCGDHEKAFELLEKVYDSYSKILDKGHPNIRLTVNDHVVICDDFDKPVVRKDIFKMSKIFRIFEWLINENCSDIFDTDKLKLMQMIEDTQFLSFKILGLEHPDMLNLQHSLAQTYFNRGDYEKALGLNEKVYELRCKILGEEHPDTLSALNNLAVTYGDLGDHKKALEQQEKCYALRCKILGEEHPGTLSTLNNLANTYGNLGNYKKALEQQEKCYALRCKISGEEHPDTLGTLNNLAVIYGALNDHKKASELFEKCYALRCKMLGEEHPDTKKALSNFAITCEKTGNVEQTKEKIYHLQCKVLGEEHPKIVSALQDLAVAYSESKEHQKEKEIKEKIYHLQYKILGKEDPKTLNALYDFAVACGKMGEYEKEVELQEKLFAIRVRLLGGESPLTIAVLERLAEIYEKSENHPKTAETLEKLYFSKCAVLDEKHPDVLRILHNLAAAYNRAEDYPKLAEVKKRHYEIVRKISGEENIKTLILLNHLADAYVKLDKFEEAKDMKEKVYTARLKLLGEENPDTLKALEGLALLDQQLGHDDEAYEEMKKVYRLYSKLFGKSDANTLRSKAALDEIRKNLSFFQKIFK